MDILLMILRLTHVGTAVFWAGASFTLLGYVQPAVIATGQEGQKFIQHLMLQTRLSPMLGLAATLNFASGLWMYLRIFGDGGNPFSSGYGTFLTLGAVAGIGAWAAGLVLQGRTNIQMKRLSKEMTVGGGPPSPEQIAQMTGLADRVQLGARITTLLLVIAVIGMSMAEAAG